MFEMKWSIKNEKNKNECNDVIKLFFQAKLTKKIHEKEPSFEKRIKVILASFKYAQNLNKKQQHHKKKYSDDLDSPSWLNLEISFLSSHNHNLWPRTKIFI